MGRSPTATELSPRLFETLERSRDLGFLGPGPLGTQVAHARGFAEAVGAHLPGGPPARVLDLGSGGGLPGLVLADGWPSSTLVLLDAAERRTAFLAAAVELLGWSERVSVVRERAEVAGRADGLRGGLDVVVARSFGPPAVTAECGAPFLRPGGLLVVSEPPEVEIPGVRADLRWPVEGLALVGLEPLGEWQGRFRYQVIRQSGPCPDRYPRRVGIPAKRPLYRPPAP